MKTLLVLLGILAALFGGLVALFTFGEVPALVVLVLLLGVTVYGALAPREVSRWVVGLVTVVFLASAAYTGWSAFQIYQALTTTEGPVAEADAGALASARAKVEGATDAAAFRLELTEEEMTAYTLDALADNQDNPLESVVLDVVDRPGEQGLVEFTASFKGGGVEGTGAVTARLRAGAVQIELEKVEMGAFTLPGLAEGALEDLIESIADLNEALAGAGADVQAIEIGNDRIVVVGTQASTDLLTSEALLSSLQRQSTAAGTAVTPPPELLGPGRINAPTGTTSGRAPFYVALGDSLAANVGVVEAQDGYVSRLHNQLEQLDGVTYGLRNFGVSGETTGTMIRTGQLDQAVEFMEANEVAYVTVDIGANNLLGHLGSDDCSESLGDPACAQRLANAFESYDDDLAVILDTVTEAAPDATVIFMRAYNPFSLGFADAVQFERDSDEVVEEFNDIAAQVARDFGVLVAEGEAPMRGTTAATTHMLAAAPDIHPNEIGFDVLACSILAALGAGCPVA